MMAFLRIAALSLLLGFVVAGFVWYGSMLAQNVLAIWRRRGLAVPKPPEEPVDETVEETTDES